jgi:type II restriction enzyme
VGKRLGRRPRRGRARRRPHTEIQGWLRDLGIALAFNVWIAANDRNRPYGSGHLADSCLECLFEPLERSPAADTIRLIDVLWIDVATGHVAAAFEVEHTTSIYSGIVRMLDLALGQAGQSLFLVASDARKADVREQLQRPALSRVGDLNVRFIPYGDLAKHRESISRFAQSTKPIDALAPKL